MSLMKNYKDALQSIYDHVGFVEDWVVYPIEDYTEMYWKIDSGEVVFHETKESVEDRDGNHYVNEIYTQRFYEKHIYRGSELVLIFVDTHTDGNKFFGIFSVDKEIA